MAQGLLHPPQLIRRSSDSSAQLQTTKSPACHGGTEAQRGDLGHQPGEKDNKGRRRYAAQTFSITLLALSCASVCIVRTWNPVTSSGDSALLEARVGANAAERKWRPSIAEMAWIFRLPIMRRGDAPPAPLSVVEPGSRPQVLRTPSWPALIIVAVGGAPAALASCSRTQVTTLLPWPEEQQHQPLETQLWRSLKSVRSSGLENLNPKPLKPLNP